jgi:hypothetical protein
MSKKIKIIIILVIVAIVIGVLIYANNKKKSAERLAAAKAKPMSLRDKVKAGIVRKDAPMANKDINIKAVPLEESTPTV